MAKKNALADMPDHDAPPSDRHGIEIMIGLRLNPKKGKGEKQPAKTADTPIRTKGKTDGKSNKLGYGGRAQQLKNEGVPGGVIGDMARKAHAAPGEKNYHGGGKPKRK